MAKDYSVAGTTKLQREKNAADALAISILDASPPSAETIALVQDYIDGKRELDDVLTLTVARYKVPAKDCAYETA
jgi:hypothetical protein